MRLEALILQNYNKLNESDLLILRYIVNNPDEFKSMGIVTLATKTCTSKSTVSRTVKKLGFAGYSELKYFVQEESKKIQNVFDSAVLSLNQDIISTLDSIKNMDFKSLLNQIYESHIIYCYATGNAQRHFSEIFAQQLLGVGKNVIMIKGKEYLENIIFNSKPTDMFIIFSLSGETVGFKPYIIKIKTKGIPLMTITRSTENYFTRHADFPFHYDSTSFDFFGENQRKETSLIGLSILTETVFRMYLEYLQQRNANGKEVNNSVY